MCEEGSGQMYAEPAEEEQEERYPSQILHEGSKEIAVTEAVFQEGEAEVAQGREYDRTCEEDLEAVEVETVDIRSKSEEEVVDDRSDSSSGDAVV